MRNSAVEWETNWIRCESAKGVCLSNCTLHSSHYYTVLGVVLADFRLVISSVNKFCDIIHHSVAEHYYHWLRKKTKQNSSLWIITVFKQPTKRWRHSVLTTIHSTSLAIHMPPIIGITPMWMDYRRWNKLKVRSCVYLVHSILQFRCNSMYSSATAHRCELARITANTFPYWRHLHCFFLTFTLRLSPYFNVELTEWNYFGARKKAKTTEIVSRVCFCNICRTLLVAASVRHAVRCDGCSFNISYFFGARVQK